MRNPLTIFVEGDADKQFILQFLESIPLPVKESCIVKTSGWNNLISPKIEEAYLNRMRRTSADGGINLVIFDADDNIEGRKNELFSWKKRQNVNFELFLFPNNKVVGELEDLLEQIINPENQPVMDCWADYETALKKVSLPWRDGTPLTIPAKKTKIYAYLEVLLGISKSEKNKIKEPNRDYQNEKHWNLKAHALTELGDFLRKSLCD